MAELMKYEWVEHVLKCARLLQVTLCCGRLLETLLEGCVVCLVVVVFVADRECRGWQTQPREKTSLPQHNEAVYNLNKKLHNSKGLNR